MAGPSGESRGEKPFLGVVPERLAPEGAINAKRRGSDHESASKPRRPTTAARVFAPKRPSVAKIGVDTANIEPP